MTANHPGYFRRVGRAYFQMRVAVKLDKLHGSAQQLCGAFGLDSPFLRSAMARSFAARTNYKVRSAPGTSR